MGNSLGIFISSILANNPLVMLFLGLCSFVGVTKKIGEAASMSGAVILVTLISSETALGLNYFLVYFNVEFLRLIVFIAVIASSVQVFDIVMKKMIPNVHRSFGIYLALITTNCLVLYVALVQVTKGYSFMEASAFSFGTGCGYALMMIVMAGMREQLELSDPPEIVKGTPLVLIIACFLSLIVGGFQGL